MHASPMCTRHFTAQERPEALYLDYAKPVNCLNSRKVLQLGMTVEMPLLRFECIQISRQLVRPSVDLEAGGERLVPCYVTMS